MGITTKGLKMGLDVLKELEGEEFVDGLSPFWEPSVFKGAKVRDVGPRDGHVAGVVMGKYPLPDADGVLRDVLELSVAAPTFVYDKTEKNGAREVTEGRVIITPRAGLDRMFKEISVGSALEIRCLSSDKAPENRTILRFQYRYRMPRPV